MVSRAVILPLTYIIAWSCMLLLIVIPSTVGYGPDEYLPPDYDRTLPIDVESTLGKIEVTLFFFPFTIPILIFAFFFLVALLLDWDIKWWR